MVFGLFTKGERCAGSKRPAKNDALLKAQTDTPRRMTLRQPFARKGCVVRGMVDRSSQYAYLDHEDDEYYGKVFERMPSVEWLATLDADGSYMVYAHLIRGGGSFGYIFTAENDQHRVSVVPSSFWGPGFILNTLFIPRDWAVDDLTGKVAPPAAVLDAFDLRHDSISSDTPALDNTFKTFHQLDSLEAAQMYVGVWRVSPSPGRENKLNHKIKGLSDGVSLSDSSLTGPPRYEAAAADADAAVAVDGKPYAHVPSFDRLRIKVPSSLPVGPPSHALLDTADLPFNPKFITVYTLDRCFWGHLPKAVLMDSRSVLWTMDADQALLRWYTESNLLNLEDYL